MFAFVLALGDGEPANGTLLAGGLGGYAKVNTAKSRNNSIFFIMSYEFY